MATVGIHIITTTYGSWLPGDDRGHWSPLFDFYGCLMARGCRLNVGDENTRRRAQSLMTESAKTLDHVEQLLVGSVIGDFTEHAAPGPGPGPAPGPGMPGAMCEPRWRRAGWERPLTIHAAAIEANHMHLLIAATPVALDEIVGRIKSNTSSAVLKLAANRDRRRTWTAGYWKVFLFDAEGAPAVQDYVEQHNVRRGLPAHRFDFVRPLPS